MDTITNVVNVIIYKYLFQTNPNVNPYMVLLKMFLIIVTFYITMNRIFHYMDK